MVRPLASACRDIIQNIEFVERFTAGQTQDRFSANLLLVAAVERCLERISEASRSIPDAIKANNPQQPWRDIANIGNILRHRYDTVDDGMIWSVVTHDLPSLKYTVEQIVLHSGP
jgi:uncharacterized protein with HEPN domain